MKNLFIAAAVATITLAAPAIAADIAVSINIGQPGFYGPIDISGYPKPQLIYRQPVIIERTTVRPPIYLRVPPGHAKHWSKHCDEYNACGERVYFVQDSWYNREYVPRYQEYQREQHDQRNEHGNDHDEKHGKSKQNKNKNHGHDD